MNDIYKQKAQKYKYKYLKLKTYFGEGGNPHGYQHGYQQQINPHGYQHGYPQNINPNPHGYPQHINPNQHQYPHGYQQQNRNPQNTFIKTLAEGGFGCVFSPPLIPPIILFDNTKQKYPSSPSNIDFERYNNKGYVGKLMVSEEYEKEYKNFNIVRSITKKSNHIPELIFAGTIQNININSDCRLLKLNPNSKWGYIITSHVGERIADYINNNNIKLILTNLKDAITSVIKPLNDNGYVHYDINLGNITVKEDKVYFIDFGTLENKNLITRNIDIIKLYILVNDLFKPQFSKLNLNKELISKVENICSEPIKTYNKIINYDHNNPNKSLQEIMMEITQLTKYDEKMYSKLMYDLDQIINLLPNNAPLNPNIAVQNPNNVPPNPNIAVQNPNPNKCKDIESCNINSCNIKLTNIGDVNAAIEYYKQNCLKKNLEH